MMMYDDGDVPDESNGPNLIRDFVKMGGGGQKDQITMKNRLIGLKIMRKPIQNASKLCQMSILDRLTGYKIIQNLIKSYIFG